MPHPYKLNEYASSFFVDTEESRSLFAPMSISPWPSLPTMAQFPILKLLPAIMDSLGTKDTSSVWGSSPVCIILCLPKLLGFNNCSLQPEEANCSPVWISRWCSFNSPCSLNFVSQSGQTYGFSFVQILQCLSKSTFSLKFLSQSWQTNGFSPVWILRCIYKLRLWLNVLSQSGQTNTLFTSVNTAM